MNDGSLFNIQNGHNELQLHFPYIGLAPGIYTGKIGVMEGKLYTLDAISAYKFIIKHNPAVRNATRCKFYQPREWHIIMGSECETSAIGTVKHTT
jgi:lipopolysaccharide transport system ATP-binding protein